MKPFRWWYVALIALILVGGSVGLVYMLLRTSTACNFPSSVRRDASIQLYCPEQAKLPQGVISNTASATIDSGAVLYSLQDGSSTLAVSLQRKPSADKLNNFVINLIPLHFSVDTPVGKAQTGVSNDQSLTTLPTNSSTWIIITAPKDYDLDRLTQILKSLRAD